MEVHVELATRSKMFTRAANVAHPANFDAPPNSLVDPMVLALPGALPVMNRAAIEMAMMVGLAINCEIAKFSKWDRKNYFYPDLPKGYQISQYDLPLCFDGELDIHGADGTTKKIGIIRAHLEEDTGKLGHELPGGHHYEGSLVDLNRAGTPLLEIVTEPDLESADDAVTFGQELRNICRFLGVTEGKRSSLLPDVPTVGETVPGYEMSVWYGAFGPAGMPRTIVAKLNAEISRILFLPDVKQKMADIAVEVAKMTPEELGTLTHNDAEKWGKLIKDLGITPQ